MRIANKLSLKLLAAVPFVFAAGSGYADPAPVTMAPPPAVIIPAAVPAATAAPAGSETLEKNVSAMDDKAADGGRNMVRHLSDGTTDPLNFQDLNSARQTVARIDAMIEIEKHLSELEKLRNERMGSGAPSSASSAALAGVIPASALTPIHNTIIPSSVVTMRPVATIAATHQEVMRVQGSEGRYTAVLKMADGSTRSVAPGDELSHGVKVGWITPSAVGLSEAGGMSQILHVKNVEMISSAAR